MLRPKSQLGNQSLIHIPAVDSVENYMTSNGQVRNWVNRMLQSINNIDNYPLLIHCTAGKDRTGVIVVVILLVIGISTPDIVEEYLQTGGVKKSDNILQAIKGIGRIEDYIFEQSVVELLKNKLIKT